VKLPESFPGKVIPFDAWTGVVSKENPLVLMRASFKSRLEKLDSVKRKSV
jgi:hypothetical protein